ncbi:hypothetical protein Y032_0002g707 [Ancylostoma ceylanicum]|uniref:Uncharacterized protein n=1 Tax=Ancylostoma ceylanicum TaxID=53326 RepID=A0A016W0W9_9BILA|nr:hypothetical protein Y032_0002g707 [Ancylostoma ceylanicum]
MPASPRNVRFTEDPSSGIPNLSARAQTQYRPRGNSADSRGTAGNPRGPGSRSTQQSLTQLDEATLDLLRLSTEPESSNRPVAFTSSKRINPAADYLPKAASTSSVNKVIRTADGGRLRVANIYTWGVDSDHEEVLDARNQVNGLDPNRMRSHGLSPQAIRRNELEMFHSRDEYVDERQAYGLSPQPRRRSEGTNVVYSVPANGYSGESPLGSPYTPRKLPTSVQTPVSPYAERREVLPPVPRHQTPPGTRRTETIVDYEKKKQGPPVVRTTVEGKLRMEKIVGADLITVDSCVSSAWTVRDTVTNYKIKSTIGKKSLILEEVKDGHSKFKITLIENGETKMEREATLEVPEFMNKKEYLSEVGQRLLRDLQEDVDAVSAVTHVEVEVVEDVTNILKTYVIGERADDMLGEEAVQALHYEESVAKSPELLEEQKVERIYVDTFEKEVQEEPEKAEIQILQEGIHFEGEGAMRTLRRLETDDSVDIVQRARCANVFADCSLVRREDSSTFTVHIAVPLVQTISMILYRRQMSRQKRQELSRAYAMEQDGQLFEDEATLQRIRRFESAEDEDQQRVVKMHEDEMFQKVEVQQVKAEREIREIEAEGGSYEMEQQGQKLKGEALIKRRGRALESESSEELPPPKKVVMQEREAEGGQYEMQMQGVTLRGEKTFRHEGKRYESDSEESVQWNGGSPTIVDLVKKESDSYFDVVFETANNYEPLTMFVERAVMKKESCEVTSAFMVPSDDSEEASAVRKDKAIWRESYNGRELSEQYANVTVGLQNLVKPGEKDQGTENNLAAVSRSKSEGRFREMKEEQAMMLYGFENTKPSTGEAKVVRKESNLNGASFFTSAAEFEHVTLGTTLSNACEMLGVQGSSKTPNTVSAYAKFNEMSLEHATSVIFLQNSLGAQDQYVEGVAKDKHFRGELLRTKAASDTAISSHLALQKAASYPSSMDVQKCIATANSSAYQLRAWASESHVITSTLMLSKGATTQTAAVKVRDGHRQETTTHIAEYGNAQEHCAVMLKNTGGAHGSTSAALAEAVSGGLLDLDTRTTQKSFHLTNYKTFLPPRGEAQIAWPQATLRSASFHLSKLSEHQKLRDENFHQDLRIRRKDAAADVTVYFLYKQVLGNFAMAALGLYLGERIRQIHDEKLTREELVTSEKHYEAHSRQMEYSDDFERLETSKHLVTDVRSGTEAKDNKQTMTDAKQEIQQQQQQIQVAKLATQQQQQRQEASATSAMQQQQLLRSSTQQSTYEEEIKSFDSVSEQSRLLRRVPSRDETTQTVLETSEEIPSGVWSTYDSEEHVVTSLSQSSAQIIERQRTELSREEVAFGSWDTSAKAEDTSRTMVTKSYESLAMSREMMGSREAEISMTSEMSNVTKEGQMGSFKVAESTAADKSLEIATSHQEMVLSKPVQAEGDSVTQLDRLQTKQEQVFRQYSDESTGLFGSLGSLTPRTPESEQTSVSINESPMLKGGASMRASSEEVAETVTRIRREEISVASELARRIAVMERASLRSRDSKEESVEVTTAYSSENPEGTAQSTLSVVVKDVISLLSYEPREESLYGSWKTGELEEATGAIREKSKVSSASSMKMAASTEHFTEHSSDWKRSESLEQTGSVQVAPSEQAEGTFKISSEARDIALSSRPDEALGTGVIRSDSAASASARLHEFGREGALVGSLASTLSAPRPAYEEATRTVPIRQQILLGLHTKASSEQVAELLNQLSKHEQIAEISMVKSMVLKSQHSLSSAAAATLTAAVSEAFKGPTESWSIAATLREKLKEEIEAIKRIASEEVVSGTWTTVADTDAAVSSWPVSHTQSVEGKMRAAETSSAAVETALSKNPENEASYQIRLAVQESTQRLFSVELEKVLMDLRSKESIEQCATALPISQHVETHGSATQYGKFQSSQGSFGTIIQPREAHKAAEATKQQFHLIQMAYATKATQEEHAELEKTLERHQQEGSVQKFLDVLRTERLRFSGFTTRTLVKAVENVLQRTSDREELRQILPEAVRTVLTLAIREIVDENAFAMIRSRETSSEATLMMTLASVESLMSHMRAPTEEETDVPSVIEQRSHGATTATTLPEKSHVSRRERFAVESQGMTAELNKQEQQGDSSRTLPRVPTDGVSASAREYGRESVELHGELRVLGQPSEQAEGTDVIRKHRRYLQLLHGVKATSEERNELVKLLSKYEDEKSVATVIHELTSQKIALSGLATKSIAAAVERTIQHAGDEATISKKVSDVLRCAISEAVKEIVDENTFTVLQTTKVASTAQLAIALSSLATACANVEASKEASISSYPEFTAFMTESEDTTIPIQGASSAERQFAVSAETLTRILEHISKEGKADVSIPVRVFGQATGQGREYGSESVQVAASLQRLQQAREQGEEAESKQEVPRHLQAIHHTKASAEEKAELVQLLRGYQEDVEVAKVIELLNSDRSEFSSSLVQEMTTAVKELKKGPQSAEVGQVVKETIHDLVAKSVKEIADETSFLVIQFVETASTTQLARTLTTVEKTEGRLFSAEERETSLISELSQELTMEDTLTMPELHRDYIMERFGMSAENLASSIQRADTQGSATGYLRHRDTLNVRADAREYGREAVEILAQMARLEKPKEQSADASTSLKHHGYLHVLHGSKATAEEHAQLMELLKRYSDDEHVAAVLNELTTKRLTFSGVATRTIVTSVEREIAMSSETSDTSKRVADVLRCELSKALKEVVTETSFTMLQSREAMTATELALALSSLETTQESARAVVEDSTSTTTDLTARPSSSKEVTLPLGGKSSAARDFAISTELLNSVLENVSEKYVATATRPLRQGETASARARELGAESVQIEASAQVLQRPPAQEGQATLTRAGYPGTSLSQSMKATSEERMELTKLLERYSEDVEEMIATVSELQKTPQSESTSHSVASALREVIAKAVKQAVEETVFTIVQYAETTSTTQLATALATSATVGSRLRAAEQEEAAIVVKLVRSILEDRTMTMPEEHRAYIQERFGIHVDTVLSTFHRMNASESSTKYIEHTETRMESKNVREYGQHSTQIQGQVQVLERQKTQEEGTEFIQRSRQYLHLLHSVAATSDEQAELIKLLSKYQDDEHVASIVQALTSGGVTWSGLAIQTVKTMIEREIARNGQTSDISKVVSDTLRLAISQVVKGIVDENAFAIVSTKDSMSTAQLAKLVSSMEFAEAQVQAPVETATSTGIDLAARPASSQEATLPVQGRSYVERRFLASMQVLHSVLENVPQQEAASYTPALRATEKAQGAAREMGRESVTVGASVQVLQRPPAEGEEVGDRRETSRRLYFTHSIKSTTEERMELAHLLKKYEENEEISRIIQDLLSNKVDFSASVVQEIITAMKELEKLPQSESTSKTAAELVRNTVAKVVKETVDETVYSIVQSMESASATQLAMALSAAETVERRLRATEQREAQLVMELSRTLAECDTISIPEAHRAYIEERFGITSESLLSILEARGSHMASSRVFEERTSRQETVESRLLQSHTGRASPVETQRLLQLLRRYEDHSDIARTIEFLAQENVAFSAAVTHSMITTVEQALAASTSEERTASTIAAGLRMLLNESIRTLTDEVTFATFQAEPEFSSITTLLVTLYSLESAITKISVKEEETGTQVSLGQIQRKEEYHERHLSLAERRRLQLIHVVKATSEERAELMKALERYQENREITQVLEILERSNVVLSQRITSRMISILEERRDVRSVQVREQVVEKLRGALTRTVQELTEQNTYAIWRTAEPTTSLCTLLMTVASIERVVANVTAPVEVQTTVEPTLHRGSAEAVSKVVRETMRSVGEMQLGAERTAASVALFGKELRQGSAKMMSERRKIHLSSIAREYESDTAQTDVTAGALTAPPTSAEEASILRTRQQILYLKSSLKACQEQQERLTVSLSRVLGEEAASKVVDLVAAQKSNMSATAVSEIQKTIDLHLQHAEESGEVRGEAAERIRAALTKCIGELTDETVHTLWRTASPSEPAELVSSLALLESVVLDTFAPTDAATELVKMLRKEEPSQLLTKLMAEVEHRSVEMTFADSRASEEVLLRAEGTSAEISARRAEQQVSTAERAVREYGHESTGVDIISGLLEYQAQRFETLSTSIEDRRRLAIGLTTAATVREDAEISTDIVHSKDLEEIDINVYVPITVTTSLSSPAFYDSRISADLSLSAADQQASLGLTAKDRINVEDALKTKQTSEEAAHGFWQTVEKSAFSEITFEQIARERDQMQSTMSASKETTIHLERSLENLQRQDVEKQFKSTQTQSDLREFSIANESQQLQLEKHPSVAGEFANIPEVSRSTTTSSAHEFGYETTGTLSTHGYLQPRPEEQATAESTVIQARRLVDDRTVSASQQEDVQRREELRKDVSTATAEITSVARVQDSSSQTMAASQEELATRAVEYLRTEQKYGVGATQAEKQSVSVGESTQETRDEAAYGVWTTAVDEETQTTISQGERTQEQLSRSVQATMEQSTAMSADFMDASSAEISSTVKLERTDSTSREFSIQQQQYESMLRKEETAVEQSSTMRDVMTATDTALVHEFGSDDVNVSGVLGHLTPKKPESAEVATQLSLAPHLEAVTSMSASTEASIQETGLIRRDEAMESTSMEQVTTIKDSTLLSTAATKEEQAEVDYRRARGSTSYGVGKSISSSSIDAAQITSKEAGETAVFGVWDSSITAEESQRTIREKSMESTDVALSTKASEMETVRSEVDLSKEPSDHAVSVLSEAQREGGRRGFSIEHLDVTTSYQRCAMGEIAVTTEKDVVVVSSTGSAAEYAREQAEVVAVLGTIEPHDEQFENAAIKVEDSKKLQLEKKMRAAEEFTTDDQLMMRREELSLQSERTIRETTVEREIQAMKASEHTSAEQVISLAAADQKEASDVEVTDRNTAASTATVQESTDEAIQGIWRTPSGAEAVYTLKEKEKSVERGALSTKASREEDVYTDAQRIRDIAGGIEGTLPEKQREETAKKYMIASELTSESVRKLDSEADVSKQLPEREREATTGEFREYTTEEASFGLVAQTVEAPKEQFEERRMSIHVSSIVRVDETLRASEEQFADQPVTLAKDGDNISMQYVTSQKQEIIGVAKLKATQEHQVEVEVDRAKQDQIETQSKLLADVTKQESALATKESGDETAAAMLRTVDSSLDTEATLRSRAMEIERTMAEVVATSEAVAEAACELSRAAVGDATQVVDDRERASDKRRLEISERQEQVVLELPSQSADVVGEQTYFHQERQTSVHREFGSEEQVHVLSMSRTEAPASRKEHEEITQKMARTLSLEKRVQATKEDIAAVTTDLSAEVARAQVHRELPDLQRAKSVGCLKATSEEKLDIDRQLSQSQHELHVQRQFRTSRDEILSSQSYKEFISEVQGLATHWDIIETDQAALICWKDMSQQSSELLTKAVTDEDIGTTLDLTVRRPARHGELQVPLDSQDSVERRLSVDETQTSFSLQRSASTSAAQHTAANKAQSGYQGQFHEFGEDETTTSTEFGKLRAKQASQEDVTKSLPDVRKLVQMHSTMASQETEISMENLLEREFEKESSAKLITTATQLEHRERLAATEEYSLSSTLLLQRREETVVTEALNKERIAVRDEGRMSESKEEVAASQYDTYVDEMSESKTIAIDNRERSAANLRGTEESTTESSLNIGKDTALQETRRDVALKSSESQERKFQIEMTKSEKHLERVDDEQTSESINTMSVKELTSGRYHEYGDEKTQICTLFGKIVQKKYESDEAEDSLPVARLWQEKFAARAAGDESTDVVPTLQRAPASEEIRKTITAMNDSQAISQLKATTSEAATFTSTYSKSGNRESASIKLRARSKERAEKKLLEQEWNLQSTASEWETILNDLEADIIQAEALHESYTIYTKASAIATTVKEEQIAREESSYGVVRSLSTASLGKEAKTFSIDQEEKTLHIDQLNQDFAEIEQLVDEMNREIGVTQSFREYRHEESDSGIALIRRSLPRTKESCTHTVSVSTSLQQSFATQAAGDDRREAVVELTLPSSSLTAEAVPKIATKESASLSAKYVTEETASTTANYNTSSERAYTVTAKRAHFIKEKSSERFKETEDGAVEILSKWEGVERDLEAEMLLPKMVAVKSSLATFETSEQVETLTKAIIMPEESLQAVLVRRVIPVETTARSFAIEELVTEAKLDSKPSDTLAIEVTRADKVLRKETWRLKESGEAKFNAVINLHKFELQKPTQKREICLPDKICISAAPVYIKADAAETDVVWSSHHLLKTPDQFTVGKMVIAANTTPEMRMKTMESGDEKTRLAVELLGTKGGVEASSIEWPLPNKAEGVEMETEEFGDEHAVLYGQINSRQVAYMDVEHTKDIPRTQALLLKTLESKEESQEVVSDFGVSAQQEKFDKLVNISMRGEDVSLKCLESGDETVALGFAYDTPDVVEQTSNKWTDKRYGGDYYLYTKTPTSEDRMATIALAQKVQLENLHHKQIQRVKSEINLRVTAATTENTTVNLNYETSMQKEKAAATRSCPNLAEPYMCRFVESQEEFANIYYDFGLTTPPGAIDLTRKVPLIAEGVKLSCDAAEDVHIESNPALSEEPQFAVASTLIKDSNKIEPAFMKSAEPTSETMSFATSFSKSDEHLQDLLVHKDIHRGSNIMVTMKESREEKHTVYQQYEQEAMKEAIEMTRAIAWFGGRFQLNADASEEHEVSATRELEKVRDAVAHCEQRTILAQSTEPLQITTKAAGSENVTVDRDWKHEDATYTISKKITAANSESATMRVEESAENIEYIYPIFNKPNDKFDLDRTMYIPRDGGVQTLNTKAVEDVSETFTADLVKPIVKELQANFAIIIANTIEPAQLHTYSSKTSDLVINQDLTRSGDTEVYKKTFTAANAGIPVTFTAIESLENSITSATSLRRDDSTHAESILINDKRYGGAAELSTKSATEVSSTMGGTLLCPRPTDLSAQKLIVIGNSASPTKLTTYASTTEQRLVDTVWNRQEAQYTVSRKLAAPNTDSNEMTVREAGDNHETTHCAYNRDSEEEEIAEVIKEKRKGGVVSLNTKSSRECASESDDTLVATRLALVQVEKIVVIANTIPGVTLSTFASSMENQTVTEVWNKPESHEMREVVLKTPQLGEPARLSAGETEDSIENVFVQLQKKDAKEDAATTTFIPLKGESTNLSKKASGDVFTSLDSTIQSTETFELDASIVVTDRNTAETPILSCGCSTEASTSGVFNLSRLGDAQTVKEVKEAANRGPGVTLEMLESTLESESATIVYERDESTAFISETINVPREGGKFLLSTGHAKEESAAVDVDWTKERQDLLEAQWKKILRNEEGPVELFASATEECATGISSQLQQSSQVELASTKRDAPRLGEPVSKSILESTTVEEINNVQLRREEHHTEVENVVKLAAYGGAANLETSYAEENHTAITPQLAMPDSTATNETIRVIHREESAEKWVSAASEEVIGSGFAMDSGRSSDESTAVTKIASNEAEPVTFSSMEAAENAISTNYALHSETKSVLEESTLKEARYGGGANLYCQAASETSPDTVTASIRSEDEKEEQSWSVKIAREETSTLSTMASSEESITANKDVLCTRVAVEEVSTTRAEAHVGQQTGLESKCSEETIFHLNYSYQKQPTEFTASFVGSESRDEGEVRVEMEAARDERVDTEELSVNRRMVEVEVEGVVMRGARETSPLLLHTESTSESVVLVDESLEKVHLRAEQMEEAHTRSESEERRKRSPDSDLME